MKFETTYNVDDKVWTIWKASAKEGLPCSFCDSERKITGKDKKEIECPECMSNTGYSKYHPDKYQIHKSFTIKKIETTATKIIDDGPIRINECYFEALNSSSTPVGSLYSSVEDAQSECDKRNSKHQPVNM